MGGLTGKAFPLYPKENLVKAAGKQPREGVWNGVFAGVGETKKERGVLQHRVVTRAGPRTGKQPDPYTMTWHVPRLEREAGTKGSGKAGGRV